MGADELIGQYIINYDCAVIRKLYGIDLFLSAKIHDPLIMSKLA